MTRNDFSRSRQSFFQPVPSVLTHLLRLCSEAIMSSKRKTVRRARPTNVHGAMISVERLETRTLLTGNLSTSHVGGQYSLTGTDAAEEVSIQPQTTAGRYTLLGVNGTTINGQSQAIIDGANSLIFNLLGGDDKVSLDASVNPVFNLAGSLTVNGGDGNNFFAIGGLFSPAKEKASIGGNLIVTGGNGQDTVAIQLGGGTVVQGSVQFNFGNGDSRVTTNNLKVNGAGGLSLAAANGDDTATFGALTVAHNVALNFGSGSATATINGNAGIFATATSTSIGGSLSMSNVNGDGSLNVDDHLTIGGSVSLSLGDFGSATFGTGTVSADSIYIVASNVDVTSNGTLTTRRDATFAGSTSTVVDLHGATTIGGNLTWRGGSGGFGNRFAVDAFSTKPLIVKGSALFVSGHGFNEITIQSSATNPKSSIGVDLTIYGNPGADIVTLDNLTIRRNGNIFLGDGKNQLSLGQGVGGVTIGGSLAIFGGDGGNSVQLFGVTVAGNTAMNLGSGADSVNVIESSFYTFQLNTGNGDDTVNLQPGNFGTTGKSSFSGPVSINLGGGNDALSIGDPTSTPAATVAFAKAVTIDGGTGLNTFDIHATFGDSISIRNGRIRFI